MLWELCVCLRGVRNQPLVGGGHGFVSLQCSSDRFKMVELQPAEIPGEQGFPVEEKQV